jgi:hypothetical protein
MTKTFLINDIQDQPLKRWIKRKCIPTAHKLKRGCLMAEYEAEHVIEALKTQIKHGKNTSAAKYIQDWESYLIKLKEIK